MTLLTDSAAISAYPSATNQRLLKALVVVIVSCASTFLITSMTTETTINKEVPPKVSEVVPVKFWSSKGRMAMTAKKKAPARVMRFKTMLRKSAVWAPGRRPEQSRRFFVRFPRFLRD